MILGGIDINLTNITTVYLPVYGLPVLLSLLVFTSTMLFFKMWIVDREVLVLQPRHNILRKEVIIRTSLRPRRSNKNRSNRRRSHLVNSTSTNVEAEIVESPSINVEAELDKPYGQALKVFYSDEQIKQALVYMNQKGIFSNEMKTSAIVGKNIEHIKNVDEWASEYSIERDLETNFPKELSKPDLINRLLEIEKWDDTEMNIVLDETFKAYGFYPIPTEFCEIYEIKKDMLRKNEMKLREEVDMLKREITVLRQKCTSQDELEKMNGKLQARNSYLEKRLSCKICSENELELMLIPCKHVYCCKECFDKQRKKWCNICNQNVQRVDNFHLP